MAISDAELGSRKLSRRDFTMLTAGIIFGAINSSSCAPNQLPDPDLNISYDAAINPPVAQAEVEFNGVPKIDLYFKVSDQDVWETGEAYLVEQGRNFWEILRGLRGLLLGDSQRPAFDLSFITRQPFAAPPAGAMWRGFLTDWAESWQFWITAVTIGTAGSFDFGELVPREDRGNEAMRVTFLQRGNFDVNKLRKDGMRLFLRYVDRTTFRVIPGSQRIMMITSSRS